jgi:hypothetical protein
MEDPGMRTAFTRAFFEMQDGSMLSGSRTSYASSWSDLSFLACLGKIPARLRVKAALLTL